MDVSRGVDARQCMLEHVAHAHLVDVAHVEHFETDVVHEFLLAGVDAADTDLAQLRWLDRRHRAAEFDQFAWSVSAETGDRHAVDVAAGREHASVEVRVRVEPEHAQGTPGLAAMPRRRADRADREAVVAAEQDRQAAGRELGEHGLVHEPVPLDDLAQVPVSVHRRQPGVGRPAQVAPVVHDDALRLQHLPQVRDAQRLRAHRRAARAGPDVGRRADQRDVRFRHGVTSGQGGDYGL